VTNCILEKIEEELKTKEQLSKQVPKIIQQKIKPMPERLCTVDGFDTFQLPKSGLKDGTPLQNSALRTPNSKSTPKHEFYSYSSKIDEAQKSPQYRRQIYVNEHNPA
jgi:hypothetical protein